MNNSKPWQAHGSLLAAAGSMLIQIPALAAGSGASFPAHTHTATTLQN